MFRRDLILLPEALGFEFDVRGGEGAVRNTPSHGVNRCAPLGIATLYQGLGALARYHRENAVVGDLLLFFKDQLKDM